MPAQWRHSLPCNSDQQDDGQHAEQRQQIGRRQAEHARIVRELDARREAAG